MNSHLVHAARVLRGEAFGSDFPIPKDALSAVHMDSRNRVDVDVKANVTPALLAYVGASGGTVVNSFPQYGALRANLPLLAVEQLAERPEVKQVRSAEREVRNQMPPPLLAANAPPAARAKTLSDRFARFWRRHPHKGLRSQPPLHSEGAAYFIGPDASGDVAHQANVARATYGVDGTGVTIGVLSSGVDSLGKEQAAGRLPNVNILPGQNGSGDEGTAILEIVYTLAPGATLYFATSHGGEPSMAANIQALAAAGCNIILDDTWYEDEPVFQDGIIAQAVDTVAAAGVFYFASAGNNGSRSYGTSSVWEGDFGPGTPAPPPLPPGTQTFSLGSGLYGQPAGEIFLASPNRLYTLYWSDPLGQSANDYDLFVLDHTPVRSSPRRLIFRMALRIRKRESKT